MLMHLTHSPPTTEGLSLGRQGSKCRSNDFLTYLEHSCVKQQGNWLSGGNQLSDSGKRREWEKVGRCLPQNSSPTTLPLDPTGSTAQTSIISPSFISQAAFSFQRGGKEAGRKVGVFAQNSSPRTLRTLLYPTGGTAPYLNFLPTDYIRWHSTFRGLCSRTLHQDSAPGSWWVQCPRHLSISSSHLAAAEELFTRQIFSIKCITTKKNNSARKHIPSIRP